MDKIFRPKAICERYDWSRATFYRRRRCRDFPPGIRLGPRSFGWRASALEEWERSRSAVDNELSADTPEGNVRA